MLDRGFFLISRLLIAVVLMSLLAVSTGLQAGSLETLVMPGEVISGHAKYEMQCDKCHEPFSQSVQSKLCLDCHKEINQDVKAHTGFHGHIKGIEQRECRSCHTDHKGRGEKIVVLDKETFDHSQTDFELKGSHAKAECAGCHRGKAKYREAPKQCIGCHKENDPHHGRLGEKCADCHDEQSWNKNRFDHNKTHFPLLGKHHDVSCKNCHPDQRFKDTPSDCYSCHQINDVHGGEFGQKCDKCHNAGKWKEQKFDHDRDTKFRLTGKHDRVKCESCHKNNPYTHKLESTCIACHKKDDEHQGHNGSKCESCHSTESWSKTSFDHDKTHFKLRNKHEKVACDACHKGVLHEEKLKTTCVSCHKKDDVHKGQEGEQCERCHNDQGWRVRVAFSHDLTRFPLIGLHAITPCEECHLTESYQDAETRCVACHSKDDAHKQKLGTGCELCHNPNGWRVWRFEHSKQTKFPLEGAHEKLVCQACHNKETVETKLKLASNCVDCHQKDDAHRGSYGQNCERCHIPASFNELKSNLR